MKFSPNKNDTLVRMVYGICFFITLALLLFHPENGPWSSILSSVSLVCLFCGMVLFIKYDCTRYEYILIERNGTLDFFVNRIVGKRGSYCVYYPLTDCIELGAFDDSTRASMRARYQDAKISKYVQNFLSGKCFYYALFKGQDGYDCVVFECDDDLFITNMREYIGKPPIITFDEGDEVTIEQEDAEK